MKKTISVVIPTYNEAENVKMMAERICGIFEEQLQAYEFYILFIDNCSEDNTRRVIRELAQNDKRIKAIFNSANFGGIRSPIYGLEATTGDCAILMAADFQDPPEMIPKFVSAWEEGFRVVVGVKQPMKENILISNCRKIFYTVMERMSSVRQIRQFTGFGLYDRKAIEAIKKIKDPMPYVKGLIAEIGFQRKEIPFEQGHRRAGCSKNRFWNLYDYAMLGITSNTKTVMRLATLIGFCISVVSIVIAVIYFVLKVLLWASFPIGMAPMLIGVFLFGGIQLFFLGLLGEYVMTISSRIVQRPLVIEEERINFD